MMEFEVAAKKAGPASRSESLDKALEGLRKDGLRIGNLSEMEESVEALTTGNIAIDALTGVGGLPRGRIVELYGPPSSGKTTTALQTAAAAQARGENILFLDFEFALDPAYCAALGLDLEAPTFLYATPDTFEDGMHTLRRLIHTGEISVAIWDSVAATTTKSELEGETKRSFSDKALLMAQSMRQLTGEVKKTGTCTIFLNHLQDVVDTSPMGQQLAARGVKRTTTPGGKALKYHASVRLEYKQVGNIRGQVLNPVTNEKEDFVTQTKVQVKVTKNKVGPPFRQTQVRVRFGKGFSQALSVIQILVAHGVIKKESGGVYRFTEGTKAPWMDLEAKNWLKGEEEFASKLEADATWLENLTDQAADLLREHGGTALADPAITTFDDETGEVLS